jgi:hypothetical protein
MDEIDNLPPVHRALVHEYGWGPVKELMALGVTKASRIEHLILLCKHGIQPKADNFKITHNRRTTGGTP